VAFYINPAPFDKLTPPHRFPLIQGERQELGGYRSSLIRTLRYHTGRPSSWKLM
jgi:hypothetical protein